MKIFDMEKVKNLTLNIKYEFDTIFELNSISNCAMNELTYKRLEVNISHLKEHITFLESCYNENKRDLSLILSEKIEKLNNVNSRVSRKKLKKELDSIENNNLFKELFVAKEEYHINYKSLKRVNALLLEELTLNKKMLDKYILTFVQVTKKRNKSFNNLSDEMKEILLNELNTVKEVAEFVADRKKDLVILQKVEELKSLDYKEVGNKLSKNIYNKSKSLYVNTKNNYNKKDNSKNINSDVEILQEIGTDEGHPRIIVDVLNTSLIYLREDYNTENVLLLKNNTVLDVVIGDYKIRKRMVNGLVQFKIVKFLDEDYVPVYDSENPGKWLSPKDFCSSFTETSDALRKDFLFQAYDFIEGV